MQRLAGPQVWTDLLADVQSGKLPQVSWIVGPAGYLAKGSPESVLAGRLEMYARSLVILTFGGGTNEIQRDLIAIFGLGLPRSLR